MERITAKAGAVLVQPELPRHGYCLVVKGELRAERAEPDGARITMGCLLYTSVSSQAYAEFLARLDRPPQPNPRLRRTLETPAPWEK